MRLFECRGYLIVVNNNVIHLHMPIRIAPDALGVYSGLEVLCNPNSNPSLTFA
jgi:hypothetical protein